MDNTQNPRHTGHETFENAAHTFFFLMWCNRDFYGGTEAGWTVIQRAKRIILLKACRLGVYKKKAEESRGTYLNSKPVKKGHLLRGLVLS